MALLAGQILAIIWIICNTLFFAPYTTYQTIQFYKHRTKPFIFNRKPSMVITFCISALIILTIVMPVCYGYEIFSEKSSGTENYLYITILYSTAATFIICFWRAWHVWFDAQYKMEEATNAWAKHLNYQQHETFKRYKSTLGNTKWTKTYLIVFAVALTIIIIVGMIAQQFSVIEGIVCFTLFVTFIGLLFVIRRLSTVKDEVLLRKEYIYIASLGTCYGICYVILFVFSHDWNEQDPIYLDVLYDALYLIIPSPILYAVVLIQTQWVLYHHRNRSMSNMDINADLVQKSEAMDVCLKDVLSDLEGFRVFMEYLVKCVSAENLLYISEVIQFMNDLTQKYNVSASSGQLQSYFEQYSIPDILPTSFIMHQIDATSIRFLRLCEKYILVQSEFEINISHKNRKNVIEIYRLIENKINEFNPKQMSKLANIFGNDSQFVASRRASKTLSETPAAEDYHQKGHHAQSSSNKISHDCLEDFQLLSNTDGVIQWIYDALCHTLGDVYSNLNDAFGRFRQTDIYWRWFQVKFKKNTMDGNEGTPSKDTSNDTVNDVKEQETKPMNAKKSEI